MVVAVADPTHRSLVDDEAVAYHEGVPGHHMQICVAQQLKGLPQFRLHACGFTAYTEGWALYAEELGKEIGFYKDPVSDYGRLYSELFRAVRLVVDTGIHYKGWTRDQVIAYLREYDVNDRPRSRRPTATSRGRGRRWRTRWAAEDPRAARARAEGSSGRVRHPGFHDEMLSGGALPLDLLDQRTDAWIASQLKAQPASQSAGHTGD